MRPAASTWSPRRAAATVVLGAWGGLFWWLMGTGRTSLYLSSRTSWVVPVGAIVLSIAFLGRLASTRVQRPEPLSRNEAISLGVLLVPVIAVLVLPPAALDSYAASRRSSISGAGVVTSTGDISSGDLTLVDVAGAQRTEEGRRALAERAGDHASFTGFVTREPGTPADEFILTRFVISCCVADALSVQVRVAGAPPGKFRADDWVRAGGKFYPLSGEVVLDATEIVKVPRPKHPYLNP